MQVAKITLWDGTEVFTNRVNNLGPVFDKAREIIIREDRKLINRLPEVEFLEMSEEKYNAIPATNLSNELFKEN